RLNLHYPVNYRIKNKEVFKWHLKEVTERLAVKTNNQKSPNLRKFFQIHAFPAVKVSQSHFMTVDGKVYVIVGQHVLRSPVFSHFDVLDHTGQRADDQIAETVYAHVSILQVTTYIEQMKDKIQRSSVNERKPN